MYLINTILPPGDCYISIMLIMNIAYDVDMAWRSHKPSTFSQYYLLKSTFTFPTFPILLYPASRISPFPCTTSMCLAILSPFHVILRIGQYRPKLGYYRSQEIILMVLQYTIIISLIQAQKKYTISSLGAHNRQEGKYSIYNHLKTCI